MSIKILKKVNFKKMMIIAGITGVIILLIHIISAFTIDRIIQYKQLTFKSSNLPYTLENYKIAFISDTHVISQKQLEEIVETLNSMEIDLMILGGDHAASGGATQKTIAALAAVNTTDGAYGVEGNHDDYILLKQTLEDNGMVFLSNSGVQIKDGFYLAGTADIWNRVPNVEAAMEGRGPNDFTILVSHNPDLTIEADCSAADLVLSGHTHGGQITFFRLFAPALVFSDHVTAYNQRFMGGLTKADDGTQVYVSRGAGTHQNVPRIFARPEVTIIELVRQ